MSKLLMALLLVSASALSQDIQPTAATTPTTPDKMRVFVAGNNATANEVRRELQKYTDNYNKKPNPKSKFCMVLVNNPKDADATLSVESMVNGRNGMQTNYTSSAQLTAADGTLLWSDSLGDGSKFMDVMIGGSPGTAASRLLNNASKKVCK